MILVDFSQVAIAGVYVFESDFLKGQETGKMRDIIRHSMLTSLLVYKRTYGKEYGELVIACDGARSWRKDVYAHYKANRKKGREESKIDWDSVFQHISSLKEELKEIFPWKVVDIHGAEGDDVIAVLTKHTILTRTIQQGFFEVAEPVMIISSDGDMRQLHDLGNVKQWSPIQKKMVEKAPKDFLIDKIIRGDGGDGVPSVLSPDDWFVNEAYTKTRAKPVTAKVLEKFKSGVGLTKEEQDRYLRNKQLISFECIPEDLQQKILDEFQSQQPKKDLNLIMEFFIKVRAKQLLERLQEFKTV